MKKATEVKEKDVALPVKNYLKKKTIKRPGNRELVRSGG